MTGGAFPGAAPEESTAWGGSDRRDPAHRGRRRTER
jgi:hypothetical protein